MARWYVVLLQRTWVLLFMDVLCNALTDLGRPSRLQIVADRMDDYTLQEAGHRT